MAVVIMISFVSPDLAIDLGCSTTRVHLRGRGIVASEPSLIAVKRIGAGTGDLVAVGEAARNMIGRVPDELALVSPVRGGVITDFDTIDTMLGCAGKKKRLFSRFRRPRIVIPVASNLTPIERCAVIKSALQAGGREVHLVPKIIAAAVGLDLKLYDSTGHCLIDLGQGTTEISILSSSRIVTSHTERLGSAALDAALKTYVRRKCNLLIGDDTAERLKRDLGSAHFSDEDRSAEIRGRSLITGSPGAAEMHSEEVREALEVPVSTLVENICDTLERTPPALAGDLCQQGITLVGGGALLEGLGLRIREATGLPVRVAENPRTVIVRGAGKMVDHPNLYRGLFV